MRKATEYLLNAYSVLGTVLRVFSKLTHLILTKCELVFLVVLHQEKLRLREIFTFITDVGILNKNSNPHLSQFIEKQFSAAGGA